MPEPEPVPTLLSRTQVELSADFNFSKPMHIGWAPGCLDVMGGIAETTGAMLCRKTIGRAAAVVLQPRSDREIQIFSFNLFDEHLPFTWRMPLDRLAGSSRDELRIAFAQPTHRWAGDIAGCLFALYENGFIDLRQPQMRGMNIAIYNTVPEHVGLGATAAIQTAAMRAFIEHFSLGARLEPIESARLCLSVQENLLGHPDSLAKYVTSHLGKPDSLVCIESQPFKVHPPLVLPKGFRFIAINSGVKQLDVEMRNAHALNAVFMAHAIILAKMREIGRAAGRELIGDPMNGCLANLEQDDYKKFFRPYLPEKLKGSDFHSQFGDSINAPKLIDPSAIHAVQGAADHHVLEASGVKQFREFIMQSAALPLENKQRFILMDKAGHLMYASHLSYMNDAQLGSPECDLLVSLVRSREKSGLYGARMTDRGCGGTVAVLCEEGVSPDRAIAEILQTYNQKTNRNGEVIPVANDRG